MVLFTTIAVNFLDTKKPDVSVWLFCRIGAQEKTRTSTPFRTLAPEASASTNSATWAKRYVLDNVQGNH